MPSSNGEGPPSPGTLLAVHLGLWWTHNRMSPHVERVDRYDGIGPMEDSVDGSGSTLIGIL